MTISNPIDLYISLKAVSSPNHVYNGGPKGATFPGWFIDAYQNEGYDRILPTPHQLSIAEVVVITDAIDRTVDQTDKSHWRVTNAAHDCDYAMRKELERQLESAEKVASRIPELRRRLGINGS